MVERVAIAICKTSDYACVCDRDGRTPKHSVPKCRECLKSAWAAIEAMREPTEEMCIAAMRKGIEHGPYFGWQAMIDAARKSPQ